MKTWLRVAITVLLCALLLIYVVDVRTVWQTLLRCDPWWALSAFAALTINRALMSYKWGLLLAIRGYRLRLTHNLMVYCSAMMWGLALPSTVGADGVRVMLARRFGVRVDDSLATILVERGVGFVCALALALFGLLILRAVLPQGGLYDVALAGSALALGVAIAILMFSFSDTAIATLQRILPRRLAGARVTNALDKLHDAYQSLAVDRKRLGWFSVLTFAEKLLLAACYGLIAKALGVEFSALFLLAAVPLAILISRLPISLDGIGVYEGIFMAVMTLDGVRPEDSLAISLAARALQILVWAPWWLAMIGRTGFARPTTETAPPVERSV